MVYKGIYWRRVIARVYIALAPAKTPRHPSAFLSTPTPSPATCPAQLATVHDGRPAAAGASPACGPARAGAPPACRCWRFTSRRPARRPRLRPVPLEAAAEARHAAQHSTQHAVHSSSSTQHTAHSTQHDTQHTAQHTQHTAHRAQQQQQSTAHSSEHNTQHSTAHSTQQMALQLLAQMGPPPSWRWCASAGRVPPSELRGASLRGRLILTNVDQVLHPGWLARVQVCTASR